MGLIQNIRPTVSPVSPSLQVSDLYESKLTKPRYLVHHHLRIIYSHKKGNENKCNIFLLQLPKGIQLEKLNSNYLAT